MPTNDKEVHYPHRPTDNLEGCISVSFPPVASTDPNFERYILVHDPYYKDDAEDTTSLGSSYVIDLLQERIVAWFNARPKRKEIYNRKMFALAEYYGAKIQCEISGGGQEVINYARTKKKLHMLEFEPEMWHNREIASNAKNRSYFMNMTTDRKKIGMVYFADWLISERAIKEDGSIVTQMEAIYDLELLEEIIRYKDGKNADRISAMIIGMYMIKEKAALIKMRKTQNANKKNSIFNRKLFADQQSNVPMDMSQM